MVQEQKKNNELEGVFYEVRYIPQYEDGENTLELLPENIVKRPDSWYLVFSIFIGVQLALVGGGSLVWTSPGIVILQSNDTEINPLGKPITAVEISILIGLRVCATLVGALFLPPISDRIGRKKSLQVMAIGMVLCIIILALSNHTVMFVIFLSLLAFCYAGAWGILPIYITEICEDHNRAKYGCIMTGFEPVGQLYIYIIGPLVSLTYFTLLLTLPAIVFLIFFCFASESPVYSLSQGRKYECIKTLKKLRSNKTDLEIHNDLYKINQTLSGSKEKKKSYLTVFQTKQSRIGLLLAMLPVCAQALCGVPIIMTLLAPIFNRASISVSGSSVAIIVGISKVCSYIFTSSIIERTGRKPMLLISSAGAVLPLSVLGLFFFLQTNDSSLVSSINWMPLASMIVLIFFYSLGMGPLPFAIMSELFPSDIRSSAISIVACTAGVVLAVQAFVYPILFDSIGIHWCLWLYAISCFLIAILIYVFLPETKGKSICEIQEMLKQY